MPTPKPYEHSYDGETYSFPVHDPVIRVAVYARISQDRTDEKNGVKRQLKDCELAANLQRLTVVDVIVENATSAYDAPEKNPRKRKTRPGFEALKAMAKAKEIDGVLAWKMDRLYRSVKDLDTLITISKIDNANFKIYTAGSGTFDPSDSMGSAMARILASIAQAEVDVKSERQARAQADVFAAGRYPGGPTPMGYKPGPTPGIPVVVEEVAVALRYVAERLLADEKPKPYSLNDATKYIRRTLPEFANIKPQTLKDILTGPTIAARRYYIPVRNRRAGEMVGTWQDGVWEPILDRDTWHVLRSHLETAPRTKPLKNSLLAGLLICANCGKKMNASPASYKCGPSNGGCGKTSVGTIGIERHMHAAVGHMLGSAPENDRFMHRLISAANPIPAAAPQPTVDYAAKLATLAKRRKELGSLYLLDEDDSRHLPFDDYQALLAAISEKEKVLMAQQSASLAAAPTAPDPQVMQARAAWKTLAGDTSEDATMLKNAVLRSMFDFIAIHPAVGGKRTSAEQFPNRIEFRFIGSNYPFVPLRERSGDHSPSGPVVSFPDKEAEAKHSDTRLTNDGFDFDDDDDLLRGDVLMT